MAAVHDADKPEDAEDAGRLADFAAELAGAVEAALPGWVERSVDRIVTAYRGQTDGETRARAVAAGHEAAGIVGAEVRALLATDVDEQRANPLAVLRRAVRYPTSVLREAGVPPVVRDEFAERAFPDDDYDLAPATWSDVDPALHEPGLVWGAAKAHVVLARRRAEGKR
ncbi:MAG: hypothetical protein ACRD0G_10240 [Acidimicrobiales bacterium]